MPVLEYIVSPKVGSPHHEGGAWTNKAVALLRDRYSDTDMLRGTSGTIAGRAQGRDFFLKPGEALMLHSIGPMTVSPKQHANLVASPECREVQL